MVIPINQQYFINNLLFPGEQVIITEDNYDAAYITGHLTDE